MIFDTQSKINRDGHLTSKETFAGQTAELVAKKFPKLKKAGLDAIIKAMKDKHSATVSTWKYASSHGVDGAPFAFVDNQRLASVPQTADDWLVLLTPLAFNKGIIVDAGSPIVVKSLDQR